METPVDEKCYTATKVKKVEKRYDTWKSSKGVEKKITLEKLMASILSRICESNQFGDFSSLCYTYPNNHVVSYMNQKVKGIESLYMRRQKPFVKNDLINEKSKPIIEELKIGDVIIDEDNGLWKVFSVTNESATIQKVNGKRTEEIRFNDDLWETFPEDDDEDEDDFKETKKYITFEEMI